MNVSIYDRPVGQEVSLIVEGNLSPGTTATLYQDGTATTLPSAITSFGTQGPSKITFTPGSTGLYTVVLSDGSVAGYVDVVSRTLSSYLRNIEDEALGSWTWNRADGTLQLLRQDGSILADFAVIDTQTESSRERL